MRWKAVANASIAMQARAGRRVDRRGRVRRRRSRRRVRAVPHAAQGRQRRVESILLLVSGAQLHELEHREDLFDDFCLSPFHPKELEARLRHLLFRAGRGAAPSSRRTATSCSTSRRTRPRIDGKPLDLTYMEYELLKFFVDAPGQGVHARAAALAGVGLRVLRRRAHGRRPRAAAARQARRGAREPDPDRALGRLPLRPDPLAGRRSGSATTAEPRRRSSDGSSASSESSQPRDAPTRSRRRGTGRSA